MKKTILVVVLALVLTIAFASSAFATTGKFYKGGVDYYRWTGHSGSPAPGTAWVQPAGAAMMDLAVNAASGGPHSGYSATTAKCGICHSVHRAAGSGVKLLPTADATCAGCHTGGTAITAKIVTWTPYSLTWTPIVGAPYTGVTDPQWQLDIKSTTKAVKDAAVAAITNQAAAGGAANGGGPHNDSALDLVVDGYWDGLGTTPVASYEEGHRYGCFTRRCHATNPHGANSSQYTMFASKLLFNNTPAQDDIEYPALVAANGNGTYNEPNLGVDLDTLGATDASVRRFILANPGIVQAVGADIQIKKASDVAFRAPDAAETHALVAGLTCGRPSNVPSGEDECHAEASYAIVDKGIKENRNHATGITGNDGSIVGVTDGNAFRTDNTGAEALGYGGNDHRDSKTGHVAGTFAAQNAAGSYVAIAGCTSCHDQTDAANTTAGNFTFPHGQVATGATNLTTDGTTSATGVRSRIWMGYGAHAGDTLTALSGSSSVAGLKKAYDGNCLKCHRDATDLLGIGKTK